MEHSRYESPTISNLRVVGTFDNNGKIVYRKQCWATFRQSENKTVGTVGAGSRLMFVPARVYDTSLSQPNLPVAYQPPPNARIVAFTVAGRTETDVAFLANMQTLATFTTTGATTYALGIQRCPLGTSADEPALRDTTKEFTLRTSNFVTAPVTTQALLDNAGRVPGRTPDLALNGNTDTVNPYAYYYKFLSPITEPAISQANRHVGVVYEGVDQTMRTNGGHPIRFVWDAPPALGPVTTGATPITVANPGLALVLLLSTSRPAGTAVGPTTTDHFTGNQAADLTLDITFELEYDKNNDYRNPVPFGSAWNTNDLQNVLE
jgi:hypothetical protein